MARSQATKDAEEAMRQKYLAKITLEDNSSTDINTNNDSHKDENEDYYSEENDNSDPVSKVAKQLGWVPKNEWSRDEQAWEPADKFLEKIPTRIKSLEEQSEKMAQAAAEAMEEAHKRARMEAEAEMLAAIESGNKELAKLAASKMTRSDDAVQVMKWQQSNPWFTSKEPKYLAAIGYAKEISNLEAAKGMPTHIQLERAEQAVKKQFPHLFKRIVAEPTSAPPVVQGGNRNSAPNPKPVTAWASLKPIEKQNLTNLANKFAKKYKMPLAEAQEMLAKSYQKPKGL